MSKQLEGWKQIADHLGVRIKTAREWAERHGLPVDMVVGTAQAEEEDLDAWRAANTVPYPEHIKRLRAQREQREQERAVAA